MTTLRVDDVLAAAVQALVNDRCKQAYMHDVRGGLQAIHTSFEVLARSARKGVMDPALIDKAVSMTKRAMAQHELTLTEVVDQLTGSGETAQIVNLSAIVQQAAHFLRNLALSRGVMLQSLGSHPALVNAQRNKLRSLVLGMLGLAIDALPSGAELHVLSSCTESHATLELRSAAVYEAIREPADLLCRSPTDFSPQDLVLAFASHWLRSLGGRLEIHSTDVPGGMCIFYPLAGI